MWLSIRKKTATALSRVPVKTYYILVGLAIIPAYIFGWALLTEQITVYTAIVSNMTVNVAILMLLIGVYSEMYSNKLSKNKARLVNIVAIALLALLLLYVMRL